MRLKATLLFGLLLLPFAAQAQYQGCRELFPSVNVNTACILLSAQNLRDQNGNKLAAGQVVLTVTDASGNPASYTPFGGSSSTAVFTAQVKNGAIQNINGYPYTIVNTINATPSNLTFHVQLQSTDGSQTYLDLPTTTIFSTTGGYSLDSYSAPAGSSITGLGYPRVTCTPTAKYTQTDAIGGAKPWICSQLWRTDNSNQWTQNPSANPQCQNGQAVVSPQTGNPYCILPENAYVLPGEGMQNPSGTTPGPMQAHALSGGGGSTPAGPAFALQFANNNVTALQADGAFTVDPINHILSTKAGNYLVGAMDSAPRKVFDPTNTARLGGLMAAIAGTSGHTAQEVVQATLDYAECQTLEASPANSYSSVLMPSGVSMNIGQILLWTHQSLVGESETLMPFLQHNDTTKAMVALHKPTDTLTCPGGVHTPGQAGGVEIKNILISGMNGSSSDIGIELASGDGNHCFGCRVSHIAGGGQTFGGQGILLLGTSVFADHLGYEDAQIQGCSVFTHGTEPIAFVSNCGPISDRLVLADRLFCSVCVGEKNDLLCRDRELARARVRSGDPYPDPLGRQYLENTNGRSSNTGYAGGQAV